MLTEVQRGLFDTAHGLRAEADRLSAESPAFDSEADIAADEADHTAQMAEREYERSLHPDFSAMSDAELGNAESWSDMRARWYEGGFDPREFSPEAEMCERIAAAHRADTERALAAREAEAG